MTINEPEKLVISGGRPDNFDGWYDVKSGWPRTHGFGGKIYFTYSQLAALKVVLLQRRVIEKLDNDLQSALDAILQALGEVDPNEGEQ